MIDYQKFSSIDNLSSRRLLKYIQDTVSKTISRYLFEPSDEETKKSMYKDIDGSLSSIVLQSGMDIKYKVYNVREELRSKMSKSELVIDILKEEISPKPNNMMPIITNEIRMSFTV